MAENTELYLHEKAVKATARFCERKGYTVLDQTYTDPAGAVIDLVVRDEDEEAVCFVDVTASPKDAGFADGHTPRAEMEVAAAAWLAVNTPEGDVAVRFDRCDMIVCSEDRALLRYHSNCFQSGVLDC